MCSTVYLENVFISAGVCAIHTHITLSERHLCAVSSGITVAYTLKEREGVMCNSNHNARTACSSVRRLWVVHIWHKPYPRVHLTACMISWQTCLETPTSLPSFPSLPLSLSLHLLFPFLNLKGDCVYSIFIILGGTVDRWDTCTITRAQHYLFQADRVKNTLSSPLTISLSLQKGWYYIMKTSPILDRKYNPDLLTKKSLQYTWQSRYDLFHTTENIPPCENQGLGFMHFWDVKHHGLFLSIHNFESICNAHSNTK